MIRLETAADITGIRAVESAAFPTLAEADLVDRLRADRDVVFSLVAIDVAIETKQVVGHALFSKMRSPDQALALAPVAVLSSHRRKGIAAALIREGLRLASEGHWHGVFVLGGPYYRRFGFEPTVAAGFASPYAGPHLMALALDPAFPKHGRAEHARAFAGLA